ncbi:MAG: hypothetical protein J7J98_02390 [candidate division Zixibacteria bacterium]|nr:hypothetical protein [candidate division Zixibacteria bacterium]
MKVPGNREALTVNRRIVVFFGVLIALCLVAGSGSAQSFDDTKLEKLLKNKLDYTHQDMLEEYMDILEDLQDILDDYGDYMEDSGPDGNDHRVNSLTVMRRNLDDGTYNSDPEKLLEDIYETVDDIKEIEQRHRVKFNTNSPRCCRLPRSLRKELIIIAELVEDYSETQSESLVSREDIEEYMDATLEYREILEDHEALAELDEDELRELEKTLESLGLAEKIRIIADIVQQAVPPDPPSIIFVPDIPEAPGAPKAPRIFYKHDKHEKIGACQQSSGVITVSNSSIPIVLENPTGDIIVTGSDTDEITATLELEVAASSHSEEKKYLSQIVLAVGNDDEHYYVSVDLPRLFNHKTDLLTCVLTVEVPESNRLECNNSFGRIAISDMNAAVSIDGKKSIIALNRINGKVDVDNSTGPITLDNVVGQIRVENSYGAIELTECSGTIVIDNDYNTVRLLRSNGRLEINNTGKIEVIDHKGDLTIENAYGNIEIDDVDGSVVVHNAYKSIIVSNVSGSAELGNEYGEISVDNIRGSLLAQTSNGPIYAEDIDGPIDLSNNYGNISVTLGANFKGGSSISNTGGTIKIAFTEHPDLLLDIVTDGGTISSNLPISVRTSGNSKAAELVLGDGGQVLELIGTNTAVIIKGR